MSPLRRLDRPHSDAPATRANRTPRLVLLGNLILVLLWLAAAGIGGPKLGQLSGLQENDSTAFLAASAESSVAREQASAFPGSKTLPCSSC